MSKNSEKTPYFPFSYLNYTKSLGLLIIMTLLTDRSMQASSSSSNDKAVELTPCPPEGSYKESCTSTLFIKDPFVCGFSTDCKKAESNTTESSVRMYVRFPPRKFFWENCNGKLNESEENDRQCADPAAWQKLKREPKTEVDSLKNFVFPRY